MLHSRVVKPDFFTDEDLGEVSVDARLLFLGLLCIADREGRFEIRPKRLQAQVFPYDVGVDMDAMLKSLVVVGKFVAYEVDGVSLGWIPRFRVHQSIHPNEARSRLPRCPQDVDGADAVIPVRGAGDADADGAGKRPRKRSPEPPALNPDVERMAYEQALLLCRPFQFTSSEVRSGLDYVIRGKAGYPTDWDHVPQEVLGWLKRQRTEMADKLRNGTGTNGAGGNSDRGRSIAEEAIRRAQEKARAEAECGGAGVGVGAEPTEVAA